MLDVYHTASMGSHATTSMGFHADTVATMGSHTDTVATMGSHTDTVAFMGSHTDTVAFMGSHADTVASHADTMAHLTCCPPPIQSRGAKRSKTYSSHSMGTPMRRPHHNWMSSPSLGSASLPQEDVDGSKNRARLYLSEGPVRIYTSVSAKEHGSTCQIMYFYIIVR